MKAFALLYYLVNFLLYILFLPFLLFLITKKKYKISIPARFFLRRNPSFKNKKIHFHACSMGEVNAIKPIVKHFDKNEIAITTITDTGFHNAKNLSDDVRFLPTEIFIPFWVKQCDNLIVAEAELWFLLFYTHKKRGAKTILVNARVSEKSFKSYRRFAFLYKMIFKNIDVVFAQDQNHADRLAALGAQNIKIGGNLKLLNTPEITKTYKKPDIPVMLAASTHEGEEAIILDAIKELKGLKYIFAPRHPERFNTVYAQLEDFCKTNGMTIAKLSEDQSFNSDITMVDSMGELINLYAISDVVVLGGAFGQAGGHNPIEPAAFNCKIISGINVFYQLPLFEAIENYKLCSPQELQNLLKLHESLPKSYIKESIDLEAVLQEIN